jgi:hypothetical protein
MSPTELDNLRRNIRNSRGEIRDEYRGVVYELDFRRRFTESVKRHPLGWIGGAVTAGLAATLFGFGGRRTRDMVESGNEAPQRDQAISSSSPALARVGWIAGAIELGKILYPVLKPVLMPLLMPLATDLIGKATRSGLAKRSSGL